MKNLMINWGLLLNHLIHYWKARIMLYDVIWSGYGSTLVDTKIGGIWMFIPPKYINILVLDESGKSPIIPIHPMTWELFQGKKTTMQETIYEGKHKWVNTDTVHRNPWDLGHISTPSDLSVDSPTSSLSILIYEYIWILILNQAAVYASEFWIFCWMQLDLFMFSCQVRRM